MTVSPTTAGPVYEAVARLPLVDHHCHGVVTRDPDLDAFESLITEGAAWPRAGVSPFDTPVGTAVRRHCAPVLGLPRHARPPRTWPAGPSSAGAR